VDNKPAWLELRHKWANEKVIVVLRHTAKCTEEPGCVKNYETLTSVGEQQAIDIGTGLRRTLGGRYVAYHSSMERTRDTALLAFGDSTPDEGISKPCVPGFNEHVHDLPIATNTILVTHSSCIDSLTNAEGNRHLGFKSGKDAHFGVAAFLERRANGLNVIGCVWPNDWSQLPESQLM
jgi:hypothetical protein